MPINTYRTRSGKKRWQASVVDLDRGLPRTKRSFTTRKAAEEWEAAVRQAGHDAYLGKRQRHTFGEALARYLTEESPLKKSHRDDVGNAAALRYPVWHDGRWLLLEHTPLDDMIPALAAWLTDQRLVTRRRYLGNAYYLERRLPDGTRAWYQQPDPAAHDTPQPRELVTDRALLATLGAAGGRGPYSSDTLRIRQVLVGRILRLAWKRWSWLDHDIAGRIELCQASKGRELFLEQRELHALIAAAAGASLPDGKPDPVAPHYADLIEGAAQIGWRRANATLLEWDRVVFPVYQDTPAGRELVQVGVIWVEPDDSKNGELIAQPIGDALLALLQRRWALRMTWSAAERSYNLVFHDGTGRPFGDTRRRWTTAKRVAGVRADFRWHDLRHTWASLLSHAGASDRELQELGGWKDASMVRRYSKWKVEHLLGAVNLRGGAP